MDLPQCLEPVRHRGLWYQIPPAQVWLYVQYRCVFIRIQSLDKQPTTIPTQQTDGCETYRAWPVRRACRKETDQGQFQAALRMNMARCWRIVIPIDPPQDPNMREFLDSVQGLSPSRIDRDLSSLYTA
jgi:hypothetical protein